MRDLCMEKNSIAPQGCGCARIVLPMEDTCFIYKMITLAAQKLSKVARYFAREEIS